MRPPIYAPTGKAKEYGDLALNIYTGCPHSCFYCFAPGVLHKEKEKFHTNIEPRPNIVEEVRKQLEKEKITDQLIHLCFTCDPYPCGFDTSATREIIKLLKASGNHIQILTKGNGERDFDLLDKNDWYGITISGGSVDNGAEPNAEQPHKRMAVLTIAHLLGIKTWVSFEPVLDADAVLRCIEGYHGIFDKVKLGKLNYHKSDINWKDFGRKAEELCQHYNLDYYIKDSLRREMEK